MYFRLEISGEVVDLYKDESVQLQRQVKDYSKIDSVFTDYSQSFNVPATDKNNRIFQSFYDENVELGTWNQNNALPARIYVHALPVFDGVVELQQVQYDSGQPTDYTIVFYGQGKSLMNLFDTKTLSDIDWSAYDHMINNATVISSWSGGLFGGNIVWDVKDYGFGWVWSKDSVQNNIAKTKGISVEHLRPSIKLKTMIQHLFVDNGLTLGGTLLNRPEFNNLFVTPMSTAGPMLVPADKNYGSFRADTTTPANIYKQTSTMSSWQTLPLGSVVTAGNASGAYNPATYEYTVPISGDYQFIFEINFAPVTFDLVNIQLVVDGKNYYLKGEPDDIWNGLGFVTIDLKRLQAGSIVKLLYKTTANKTITGTWICNISPFTYSPLVQMHRAMPDMKCAEFLDGILKAFNAIIIPSGTNSYEMHNLQDWYALGVNREYTQYIDFKKHTHKKVPIPREIVMKHQETASMPNEYFKKLYFRSFGDVSFQPDVDFADDKLEITSPFSVNVPALMNEVRSTGYVIAATDLEMMCIFNNDAKGIQEKLCLFYYQGTYAVKNKWYLGTTQLAVFPRSSTFSGSNTNDYSLCYGLEANLSGNMPKNTLYFSFWNDYISRLYSTKSRIMVFEAVIPVGEWLTMKLNDTYVVSGNYYKLQNIKYDMLSQKAIIELMTYPNVGKIQVTSTTGKKPLFDVPISTKDGKTLIIGMPILQKLGNAIYDGSEFVTDAVEVQSYNVGNCIEFNALRDNLVQVISLNKLVETFDVPAVLAWTGVLQVFPFTDRGYEGYQGYYNSIGYGQVQIMEDGQYRFRARCTIDNVGGHVAQLQIQVNGETTEAQCVVSGNHISTMFVEGNCTIGAGSIVSVLYGTGDGGAHAIPVESASWSIERII